MFFQGKCEGTWIFRKVKALKVLRGGVPQGTSHKQCRRATQRLRKSRVLDYPCAWTAVIAATLTISSTEHPLDRSLTGLASPWMIGPTASAPATLSTSLYAMLPASRSGKIRTFALPATGLPGASFPPPWGGEPHRPGVPHQSAERDRSFWRSHRLEDLVDVGMTGATLGGEGEHGNPRIHIEERFAVSGSCDGDFRQRLRLRVRVDCTVGEKDDAVFTEGWCLGDHQEVGRDSLYAWSG